MLHRGRRAKVAAWGRRSLTSYALNRESDVAAHSAASRRSLGRAISCSLSTFIIGLSWVGAAGKLGPAHVVFWLLAITFFYFPSAAVVIYLNGLMPLEGGLYQWAKFGFNEAAGFMVAWNLWLYVITNTSEIGLQLTTNLAYAIGPAGAWISSNKWLITLASLLVSALLVTVSTLDWLGKWLHTRGAYQLRFRRPSCAPLVHVARGEMREYHRWATDAGFLALQPQYSRKAWLRRTGWIRYVAILAGECRNPARTRPFGYGGGAAHRHHVYFRHNSVLAFVPPDHSILSPQSHRSELGIQNIRARDPGSSNRRLTC